MNQDCADAVGFPDDDVVVVVEGRRSFKTPGCAGNGTFKAHGVVVVCSIGLVCKGNAEIQINEWS